MPFGTYSINQLSIFFYCQVARLVCPTLHVSFNMAPSLCIDHMFSDWLIGVDNKVKNKILVGTSALCWAIWLSRHDVVFNNTQAITRMQVIVRGTYWLHFWVLLQKEV